MDWDAYVARQDEREVLLARLAADIRVVLSRGAWGLGLPDSLLKARVVRSLSMVQLEKLMNAIWVQLP